MKKLRASFDNIFFGYHWRCIGRLRSAANTLIADGADCTDPRLITISNKVLVHGMEASRIWHTHRHGTAREQVTA